MNPPSHAGWYTCGICGGWVMANEMVLDHIIPVGMGGSPSKKYDLNNLQPAHWTCNSAKGSKRNYGIIK
jgi:5-methylcytosine-specific restriction endonuclease McrA